MALPSGRFSDKLSLVDDRDDAAGAELEQVVIDFAEDRFRHAVFQMNAAVRVNKIVFVVVTKEWSEAEAFDVEVCLREESRAAGTKRRTDAVAAVAIGVHRYDFGAGHIVIRCDGAEREFRDEFVVQCGCELVCARHVETELAREFEVAPEHLAGNAHRRELSKRRCAENIECLGSGKTLRRGFRQL